MYGTTSKTCRAINQPLLLIGVEKRLAIVNLTIGFSLVAATHFQLPASMIGISITCIIHGLLMLVSKHDPMMGKLFKRSTRYCWQCYFPAKCHPLTLTSFSVHTLG